MCSLPPSTCLVLPGLALALLTGCGESGPATVPVRGVVTYNGTPLPKGSVVFAPVDPSKCKGGTAAIGRDGRFRAATTKPGDGLMPGEYKVAVTSYLVDQVNTPPPELAKLKDGGLATPSKYTDVGTSGLVLSVTPADAAKEFKIELQD
jgi:hypothetical protein